MSREGKACGGLPFPGTGCPIPDVDYLCLLCSDFYVWDAVSMDFAFQITDWTCCHIPHVHAVPRIINRGVSGLAADSPCGVRGCGWTTCLLHDSPLFRLTFKNESWYVSLDWYFTYLLFLASVHGFMHETSDFLLYNSLFIYQVFCTLIYRRRSLTSFLQFFIGIRSIHIWGIRGTTLMGYSENVEYTYGVLSIRWWLARQNVLFV